ncbi:MAG: tryptophan--tRNA ligase [Pseudomonadota bacterium]
MSKPRFLTGITTTGTPHLGNYVGAIRPAVASSQDESLDSFYFLADYHSLIKSYDAAALKQSSKEIAATWLAFGLNTDNAVFYRQSDIPEIPELTWMLTCVAAKGLMNRAHAYKAAVADNEEHNERDADKGITMGLFSYPILMAADILMFKANKIPVGRDQIQHVEMARDIAARFNHHFGEHLVLPEAAIDDNVAVLNGLDGRKMSKSYNNTIPLFESPKRLRKLIMKIKTNSLEPGEPKDTEECTLFQIYQAFASSEQTDAVRQQYAEGIAWGEMKQMLFEHLEAILAEPRERYEELMAKPEIMEGILRDGAERAREYSVPLIQDLRGAIGLGDLASVS